MDFLEGDYRDLGARNLNEATCRKFGYFISTNRSGQRVQVATYRDQDGVVVAQKVRTADKQFSIIGEGSGLPLFGQHLWPSKGKRVVVTEGEIDAMSVAQATGLSWPAVSVPNGSEGAKKAVARALEWLSGYEQVVFCFDMDDPGRKAAVECAALLPPGKATIAELPLKDANEMLKANRVKDLSNALWNARTYRPGGIVSGADVWDKMVELQRPGIDYPFPGLTAMLGGQRHSELVTWTSGTGMGKSSVVAQVAYQLAFPTDGTPPCRVGYVALEESVGRAAQRFVSHHIGKLTHVAGTTTQEDLRRGFDETLGTGRVWFHDHFGTTDSDDLIGKLRYLAVGCGCDVLVLDHLSIIVSGMDLGGDERRTIDNTMTKLRTLVQETGALMHLVSHLKRPEGAGGHEEGGRVHLSQLRGSASIAQLSDIVIGLERNQQADSAIGKRMTVRVLKNRTTGHTGVACVLEYDDTTGRSREVAEDAGFTEEPDGGTSDF